MRKANRHMSRAVAIAIAGVLTAQAPAVQAAIVDTDALAAPTQASLDRAKVQEFLERANVKERMRTMGVSGVVATARVESLSESEVHALAQRIDTLPAGGQLNLSTTEWILIGVVALLLLAL